MNEAEFDKFADEYYAAHKSGITLSGEDPEYFYDYKIADIAREWRRTNAANVLPGRVLDFGAGTGNSIPYVRKHLPAARLICLDPSRRSLDVARERFSDQAEYVHFDGVDIPFPENHFDIVYATVVFHHIDHADHVGLLTSLRRILRPGGSLFIFEHNPYNPLTVRVVNNCAFDENARLIRSTQMKHRMLAAGFRRVDIRYRVFFPHLLKALRPLERALTWCPLGAQYYAHSVK